MPADFNGHLRYFDLSSELAAIRTNIAASTVIGARMSVMLKRTMLFILIAAAVALPTAALARVATRDIVPIAGFQPGT
ncbi:MAG: hypothetical protein ACRECA_02810, partial [Pseudolabrys sp.]